MASPLYNGEPIFDSINADGGHFSEGVLECLNIKGVTQDIHFEGENGSTTLTHGFPNRPWVFEGYISATNASNFNSIRSGLESAVIDFVNNPTVYHALVDSFGVTYANAQVQEYVQLAPTHVTAGGGFITRIRVTGIVQGTAVDSGADGGSSGS